MMGHTQEKAVRDYRNRLQEHGIRRVEVHALQADVALLREIAKALRDPVQAERIRGRIRFVLQGESESHDLKKIIASMPCQE